MRKYTLVILFFCLSPIFTDDSPQVDCFTYPYYSDVDLEECSDLTPAKGQQCCLLEYKNNGGEGTACIALDDAGKKDRNSIINELKKNSAYKDATANIICEGDSSSFLKVSLLFISLLLII